MNQNLESTLFTVKEHKFCVKDFLSALDYFGILEDWQSRVQSGLQAVQSAEGGGKSLDESSIEQASKQFRYKNDLLNETELKDWLHKNFLVEDDLEQYLIRQYWEDNADFDIENESLEVENFVIYSEIVLSGAYESLLKSWSKRLVSWFEKHDQLYQSFDELEAYYKCYEKNLNDQCDLQEWLQVSKNDLRRFNIEILAAELPDFSKARQLGEFDGYYKDMPPILQKFSQYLTKDEFDGPFADEDNFLWFKLLDEKSVDLEDEEIIEYARDQYKTEVWKTLSVKHLYV